MKAEPMQTGTVWCYHKEGGFGIIRPDGGGHDAFVHISAVKASQLASLEPCQRVSYVLKTDARGQTCAHELQAA